MALSEGYPYDKQSIATSAPAKAGVYGLYRRTAWIYWGETANIRDRLTQHLDTDWQENPCIVKNMPIGFCYELVAGGKLARRQARSAYIRSHGCVCNR